MITLPVRRAHEHSGWKPQQYSTLWSVHQHVWPCDLPLCHLFHSKTCCVLASRVWCGRRARIWNRDDSTGSMKTFSGVANGVLLTTNGLQMVQTKKLFWIPAITSFFKRNKKKKKQFVENVSLENRICYLMFWLFFYFFSIMEKQLREMPDAVSQSFRSQNNQSVRENKSVFLPLGSIASLGI